MPGLGYLNIFDILLFLFLKPCAVAVTYGVWLALLSWLVLPAILERRRVSVRAVRKAVQVMAPAISWTGGAVVLMIHLFSLSQEAWLSLLVVPYPWLLLSWLPGIDSTAKALLWDWTPAPPLALHILAVEAPLVLAAYYGLPTVLGPTKVRAERRIQVRKSVLALGVLIGVITGLIGFGWPVYAAVLEPDSWPVGFERLAYAVIVRPGAWADALTLAHHLSPLLVAYMLLNPILILLLSPWTNERNDEQSGIERDRRVAVTIAGAVIVTGLAGSVLTALYMQSHPHLW